MSVRVIRASRDASEAAARAASEKAPSAPFAATAFRLGAERFSARVDADRMVAAARREAEQLVEAARVEAERVRASARAEGLAAAHAEAFALLARAREQEARLVERALPIVEQAVVAVAERLLAERFAIEPAALAAWVRAAIAPLMGARRLQLRAAPSTLARLAAAVPELAARGLGATPIELEADDALADGVAIARTDLGEVRLDLASQLPRLVEAIRPALEGALRGARG